MRRFSLRHARFSVFIYRILPRFTPLNYPNGGSGDRKVRNRCRDGVVLIVVPDLFFYLDEQMQHRRDLFLVGRAEAGVGSGACVGVRR